MSLYAAVKLYRFLNCPECANNSFDGKASFSELMPYVKEVVESKFGRFEEIIVDEVEYQPDCLPESGEELSFTYNCVSSSTSTFYKNVDYFINSNIDIHRGAVPYEYYLVDENYYSKDECSPDFIPKLNSLCELISALSKLALYHDYKDGFRLVFLPSDNKEGKPIVVETKITRNLLEKVNIIDCRILNELSNGSRADPHYSEKIGVFGATLSELFQRKSPKENSFDFLVSHWGEFLVSYHNHLSVYLSGFAFHKAKREVAEAEFDLAGQFSKVIGDIATKLFGIPISFAALIVITKNDDGIEVAAAFFSLLFFGLIMFGIVKNQRRHLNRILHARDVVLGAIEGKRSEYPDELSREIDAMNNALIDDEKSIKRQLNFYSWLIWIPFVSASLLLFYRYRKHILCYADYIFQLFTDHIGRLVLLICSL